MDAVASSVLEAVGKTVANLGTMWVKVPTIPLARETAGPTPSGGSAPYALDPTIAFIQQQLWWLMTFAAVFAVIIGGARMAWERRADPAKDLARGLLTLVVVSGCGVAVIALCTSAADQFSAHIIESSLAGGDFAKRLGGVLGVGALNGGVIGAMLVIVLGLIAVLVSIVQIILMAARSGMLILMAGALPLAAAFTNTEAGRSWFRRFTAWTFAFILYKPAAAVIYATMFQLIGNSGYGDQGLMKFLAALSLMTLSVVALPALMRFLTPMTASMAGGGGGGGGLAAGAALAAAMPTGALALGRGSGGGSFGGSEISSLAGPRGPSGAGGADSGPRAGGGGGTPPPGGGAPGRSPGGGGGASTQPAGGSAPSGNGASGSAPARGAAPVSPLVAGALVGAEAVRQVGAAGAGVAHSQDSDRVNEEGPRGSQ